VTRSTTYLLACALVGVALFRPADAEAQHRRGIRSGGGRPVVVVSGFYHRPWLYDGWYGWGGGPYEPSASLRLQVEPKNTEVFIDGYYAGTVDDFDGFFQRLRVEPGEHDIQLYLEGHKIVRQKIYLQPTGAFRVKQTMQPLAAGDTPDPRPVPPSTPPAQSGRPYDASGRPDRASRAERPVPAPPSDAPDRAGDFGALALRVQPAGAEVHVDGERWEGTDGADRLVIQLPEGEHRIEVRLQGFAAYSSTVRVRRGETTALNVSLARE
jgi:PEGA domain